MNDFFIQKNPNNLFDFNVIQIENTQCTEEIFPKDLPFILAIDDKTFKMYFADSQNILHIFRIFLS